MSTTLTIRNLDDAVKQKLRLRAARHQTSMEAEARAILARAVDETAQIEVSEDIAQRLKRIESAVGIWKDENNGRTTDEIMRDLRGEE